jgi:hypothetical protein
MLCNSLENYHLFPGFTLLLGSLCQYVGAKQPYAFHPGIVASLYLTQHWGEGRFLDDTELFGANGIISHQRFVLAFGSQEFFSYFTELLESPERSSTHLFDQKQYAMAAKECLQLYLCSYHHFSKGATEFAYRDKVLCRNKPSAWISRLGVHSRIRKGRHHFKVQQFNSVKAQIFISQVAIAPENFPKHEPEYYQFLSYRWALDLLPLFLERSAISLELADVLRSCTFTTMAWKFPRRKRLAKEAIARYLFRVESAVGEA